jgi:penicillin G amidase
LRQLLRFLLWTAALVFVAGVSLLWWYVYRPLPQLDGTATLPGLHAKVTVDRDSWGIPHIQAGSLNDLVEAQGYVMAQDRLWQMDLLRRLARGELSEIFGEQALKLDREYRTLGFNRAAERDVELLDAESRSTIEAYAHGVNHFIETHRNRLPLEFLLLHYKPRPWRPADSYAIGGYMFETLTDTWEAEIARATVTERVGFDRARNLFSQDSEMDRFVVGGPDASNPRHRPEDDEDDDEEMQAGAVVKTGFRGAPNATVAPAASDRTSPLWPSVEGWLSGASEEVRRALGSNNWVISGAHTASGKPLLANDTHLELTVPSIWYQVHLTAPGWNLKGFTLPGAPLVIIGHNDRIAWGFTNNFADVQDLYVETFNAARPDEYRVRRLWQKAQVVEETIHVKGRPDEKLDVVITRHGPIVRREGEKAYALRWTALDPGCLTSSYTVLGRAQNWEQFRKEARSVCGPGQNAVYADVDGNIGYIMAAHVPVRKKGRGEVPVPGDTDDYEWAGYVPFEQLPQVFNPESGLIATANARVAGPRYKPYLTDRWEEPYRTARIYDLLKNKHGLLPADMLNVQTDTYSYPHLFLANQLEAAAKTGRPKDPRAQTLIERLKDWNGIAETDSPIVSFLAAVRRSALEILLEPYLGQETGLYQWWRTTSFLRKILTDRPAIWLPAGFRNYDDLLLAAADRGVAKLESDWKSGRIEDWNWGRVNSLEMLHALGREGVLRPLLGITDKPQAGTLYSVRAASRHVGPAMRFVADLANWDDSIMLIPTGESGQFGSAHYTDQFPYWYQGKPIAAPYSEAAEEKAREHRLTLKPAP